jgi:glycosyltransferase involved in cell wall biosynthesis
VRAIFFTDGVEVPASRYRCEQFFPHFAKAGVQPTLSYAYGYAYNRVHRTKWGDAYKLASRMKRAAREMLLPFSDFDVAVLQRTAVPHSALPERFIGRMGTVPTIFDFDDSLHLGVGGAESPARERAFHEACAAADHLVAGNEWLAELANHPEKTTVIPTVIDTDRYVPAPRESLERPDEVVVGWMGTSGNFLFLERIARALENVLRRFPKCRVRIVSNAEFSPLAGVPRVEQIRWSAEREIELLQSFDIGLMPLEDSPVSRGKCAFKMIQYMAVGAPSVVSAVGANVEVARGTELGILVHDWRGWEDAISELVRSPELRASMGRAGRERAVSTYSVDAVLPTWLELLQRWG